MTVPLTWRTYLGGYKPIPAAVPGWDPARQATWPATTATVLASGGEALLVDALMTVAEGQALASWIAEHRAELTAVYVTHGHADHFFGATQVLERFPRAQLLAHPNVAAAAAEQGLPGYLQVWGSFFPAGQIPDRPEVPTAMDGTDLIVGGHLLRTIDVGQSDVPESTVVHVEELGLVVAGDIVYNGIHMWLQGSTPATRSGWRAAVDAVEKLDAHVIIAGHKDPGAPDDDAQRLLDHSRQYLSDFDDAVNADPKPAAIIDAMLYKYPDLGNPYTLWVAAHSLGPA